MSEIRILVDADACPVKVENAKPVKWTVDFGLNAKNANGGYSGLALYTVAFKNGVITYHAYTPPLGDKTGWNGLIAKEQRAILQKCTPVPDAKIQALLATPQPSGGQG